MATSTNAIISRAAPHTIKKFELISNYVDGWARKILGYGKSQGIIYIDCMSNSGVYTNNENIVEGTAIRVAKELNEIISNYPDKKAIAIFNDLSKEKINLLEREINKLKLNSNIEIYYHCEDRSCFLHGLALNNWEDFNILLVYDPYKAEIDWNAITPFLNTWGEVIINHMVFDTNRGASQAKRSEVINRYEETYQKDISSIIDFGRDKDQLEKIIESLINRRSEKHHHIASFPFFTRTNGLLYNLILCTTNIEGLKLYKKTAWKLFGGKSSLKNTHDNQNQLSFDFGTDFELDKTPDTECYTISDIARYIFKKYNNQKNVLLEDVYKDLDEHPIFPSDGFKTEIKKELRKLGVKIMKDSISFS